MIKNCRNCGAPTDGIKCEYCGTIYEKRTRLELRRRGKPVPKEEMEEALCDPFTEFDVDISSGELVRCKDCAYAIFKEGVVQHGHIVCTKPFTEKWQTEKPSDWFCDDGKRKETK